MMPPSYNDIHQIFQTPDHVVVFSKMANNPPRIIPLDGRPHVPDAIRQFPGDWRGRWDGDTLVVETRNYAERRRFRGPLRGPPTFRGPFDDNDPTRPDVRHPRTTRTISGSTGRYSDNRLVRPQCDQRGAQFRRQLRDVRDALSDSRILGGAPNAQ